MMSIKETKTTPCRICLDTKYLECVSFDDSESEKWIKIYEFCFGLTISPEDTPRTLCGVCVNKMEEFNKLKCKSIESDKLWRQIISVKQNSSTQIAFESDESLHIKEENDLASVDACDDDDGIHYEFQENDVLIKKENTCFSNDLHKYSLRSKKDDNINNVMSDFSEKRSVKKKKSVYCCSKCKSIFKYAKAYQNHIAKSKCKFSSKPKTYRPKLSIEREFYCGLCDEKAQNYGDLKKHLSIHSEKNDLSCKLCKYTGRDFADMETHRYTHGIGIKMKLKCHVCDQICGNKLKLQYHYRTVHLKKIGGLCTVCNKQCHSYKTWRNHERLHKTAGYICDHCGLRFLFRNTIIEHIKEHSNYRGYVCDVCGKGFKRARYLKIHIQQVHDGKQVKCTHCNKTFKNEKNLQIHKQREAREKKYQCEFCSKCYSLPSDLKGHMVWHSDQRPFVCKVCGSAYKANSQLKIHMRSHTGNLPFKCTAPNCSKAFACSNQLKAHFSVHSGVKRYKCPFCDKTFHNKSPAVMHCAKRHNVTDVVIEPSKRAVYVSEGKLENV